MTTAEAFRIVEPNGKTYRLFADGRIEGFEDDALIVNYVPALVAQSEARHAQTPHGTDRASAWKGARYAGA